MLFCKSTNGIHPKYYKETTQDAPIREALAPKIAVIPLIQHTGAPCEPIVKIGDRVKIGSKIGDSSKFISSPVHSSISGTVTAIDKSSHPALGMTLSVYIENDGKQERDPGYFKPKNADALSPDEIRLIIKEAGIVGLGGAALLTLKKKGGV